jgi:hypothetical protein
MISNKCHYALRAMLELALRQGRGPVTIGEIAAAQGHPGPVPGSHPAPTPPGRTVRFRARQIRRLYPFPGCESITVNEVIRLFEGPLVAPPAPAERQGARAKSSRPSGRKPKNRWMPCSAATPLAAWPNSNNTAPSKKPPTTPSDLFCCQIPTMSVEIVYMSTDLTAIRFCGVDLEGPARSIGAGVGAPAPARRPGLQLQPGGRGGAGPADEHPPGRPRVRAGYRPPQSGDLRMRRGPAPPLRGEDRVVFPRHEAVETWSAPRGCSPSRRAWRTARSAAASARWNR